MKEGDPMPTNNKPNRLIAEKSPYLLQHAHNPVDWFLGEKKHLKKRNAKTSLFSYLLGMDNQRNMSLVPRHGTRKL